MNTLKDKIGYELERIFLHPREEKQLTKLLPIEVIKEFSMAGNETSNSTWLSWQEFGSHKYVCHWYLLQNGYAVGFNENPSIGWSFPVVKLKKEMLERAISHSQNYFQYRNINPL